RKMKNIPEIRFKEFEEEWLEEQMGDIVDIVMGQSPSSVNYTNNPNDNILVQGNADMHKGKVVPRIWTTQITKQAEKGDLILSIRAPVGDVGKTDYNVVLGRGVAGIKGNEFVFQLLTKMKEDGFWNKVSTGSTFESINSNNIKEALVTTPKTSEQQKIGNFFRQLDQLIEHQEAKLKKVTQLKAAMLDKMFPKEGSRVPEIRFKGFEGEWEEKKLEKIASYRNGKAHENIIVENGRFIVVNSKFISTEGAVKKLT